MFAGFSGHRNSIHNKGHTNKQKQSKSVGTTEILNNSYRVDSMNTETDNIIVHLNLTEKYTIYLRNEPFEKRHIQLIGHIRPAVIRWAVQVGFALSLDIPLGSGERPTGFNPIRRSWVYRPAPEAPLLGECRRGQRHFWKCRARVGSGPAPGPTL